MRGEKVGNLCVQTVYISLHHVHDLSMSPVSLALFLKENIVGCVLLISLLIWIPGGCIFHWLVSHCMHNQFRVVILSLFLSAV